MNSSVKVIALASTAGAAVVIGALLQTFAALSQFGVEGVFQALKLTDEAKVNLALYFTVSLAVVFFVACAAWAAWRSSFLLGGLAASCGLVLSLLVLALPSFLGFIYSAPSLALGLAGSVLLGAAALLGFKDRGEGKTRFMSTKEVGLVAVFSALTAVVTSWTGLALPSPTGGYTNIGDTVIFLAALLFGARVGGLVGVVGPVVADILIGYPRWFVTVFAHGSEGFIAGFGRGRSLVVQVVLLAVSGFVMATSYFLVNVFIKGYPVAVISYVRDLFGQALVSIILALILTKGAERALKGLKI
jgi:uncharacterized membrane protein